MDKDHENGKSMESNSSDEVVCQKEVTLDNPENDSDLQLQPSAPPAEAPDFIIPACQVELTLSASLLMNSDMVTRSDPFCVVYLMDSTTSWEWIEFGRTETVMNDLSPEWKTKFIVDYRFEEKQLLTFMIYDRDCEKVSLENHDFLGKLECSMGEIMTAPMSIFSKFLKLSPMHSNQNAASAITIISEELSDCKQFINIRLKCSTRTSRGGIRGMSLKAKKAFVNVSKQQPDGSWILLNRTERVPIKNFEIDFPPVNLRYTSVCNNGNLECPLRFQLLQVKYSVRGKAAKIMGEAVTSFIELTEKIQNKEKLRFPLYLGSKGNKEEVGRLEILNFVKEAKLSFLDYLHCGLEMNFAVAIDFTASNGEPTNHSSLHYRYGINDNPYVMTLKIIANILEDYCYSKQYYAYGFGAKGFPAANRVNHKFALNFKESNPLCNGIEGVISAYSRALQRVKLFGPTCFAPIIKEVIRLVEENEAVETNKYFVLLILTDGIICDPETTVNALVEASDLPISVIIVGIGDADFSAMERFDSDEKLLQSKTKAKAVRDIVQFVELRKYVNFKSINPISEGAKVALGRSVLAELPQQVVDWMSLLEWHTD